MSNAQTPLGTRFTAASTADDVVDGVDLGGRNIIVTGGHAGIGLETTRALVGAGASVTVPRAIRGARGSRSGTSRASR